MKALMTSLALSSVLLLSGCGMVGGGNNLFLKPSTVKLAVAVGMGYMQMSDKERQLACLATSTLDASVFEGDHAQAVAAITEQLGPEHTLLASLIGEVVKDNLDLEWVKQEGQQKEYAEALVEGVQMGVCRG